MTGGLASWVREAMKPLGVVHIPPRCGGHSIYLEGLIFAMLGDGDLWFRSDTQADAVWNEAGCERFTFNKGNGVLGTMNYRRATSACHDDPEVPRMWAKVALAASRRLAAKKRLKRKDIL